MKDKQNKQDEVELLKARLDVFCQKYPNVLGSSIQSREGNHHYLVTHGAHTYGRFESQFGTFFDIINKILLGINYIKKDKWPNHRVLQYLMIQNNLISLRNSVELALNGYYSDSLILARVNLEALVRCLWMSCHPENCNSGVIKIKGKKEFNYTNFISIDLKLDWKDYGFWSPSVHANQVAVVNDWIKISKKEKDYPICLELKFDKKMIEICINSIVFLELFNLKFVVEILVTGSDEKNLPMELIEEAKEYILCYEKTIRSHPKKYWPKIPDDLIDLMALIKELDAEKGVFDFKIKWAKIRNQIYPS